MTNDRKILFPKANATFTTTSGYDLAQLFMKWRKVNMPIETLVDTAMDHFDLRTTCPEFAAALHSLSKIADVPHAMPFHNNHHFREVFASTMRLCHVYQQIAPSKFLTADISKCLIAALIHDVNHDGTDNTMRGKHTPFRLEDIAFNTALPILKKHNIHAKDIRDIHTIIRTTDASSDSVRQSPNTLLRDTYAKKNSYLPASLSILHHDPVLLEMAAIVADADMTPTMGTTPEYSLYMSACFCKEKKILGAPEKENALFLTQGPKGFITPIARKISMAAYDDMISRIPKKYTRPKIGLSLKK